MVPVSKKEKTSKLTLNQKHKLVPYQSIASCLLVVHAKSFGVSSCVDGRVFKILISYLLEGDIEVSGFGPFLPRFFRVIDFEAQFCGFLQHHGLWLLVLIIAALWFADVVHGFLVAL